MLQLCHRYSYDFDILTPKMISKKFIYKVKQYFKKINVIADTADELSFVSIPHKVKLSFIYYPFAPLYQTLSTRYLKFFFWKEIGLDKAYTIGRRGEWRDYVDIYFIIKKGFSLPDIIKGARKKFSDCFSEKLFLSQIVYYRDLKDFTIEFIKEELSPEEIQNFLIKEVENYKEKIFQER